MLAGPDGCLQYYKGVPYYSPNSTDASMLFLGSAEGPDTLEANPFKPGDRGVGRVRYSEFVNPRKWTSQFSWISFIPAVPSQSYSNPNSYLGRLLHRYPSGQRYLGDSGEVKGFRISDECPWVQLEDDLYRAVVVLSHHYHIQCVLPFLPNVIGYQQMYSQKRHLDARLIQAREWFFVWFGALSYLIAVLRDPPSGGRLPQSDQQWCSVLHAKGLSPTFVDGISSSLSEDTWSSLGRAGVILDIVTPPEGQPHPSWFVKHGVPVWYRWGEAEERSDEQSMRPPAALLPSPPDSRVTSSKTRHTATTATSAGSGGVPLPNSQTANVDLDHGDSPLLDQCTPAHSDDLHSPLTNIGPAGKYSSPHPDGHGRPIESVPSHAGPTVPATREPAWVHFLEAREKAHVKMLENETEQKRQARENRMREPPTSSAPVFEWCRNYSSDENFTYERLPVLAKARYDTLEGYGKAQKRYDPFFNEWDCCDEWGPDDSDSDDGMSTYGEGLLDDQPLPPAVVETLVLLERPPAPESPSYADSDRPNGIFVEDYLSEGFLRLVDEIFGRFYGFARSAHPVASTSLPNSAGEDAMLIRILGNAPNDVSSDAFKGYSTIDHYRSAQAFVTSLCSRSGPLADSWDLRDNCAKPVRLTPRFRQISIVKLNNPDAFDAETKICYVVDDRSGRTHWRLGVITATAALLVCRLPEDSNAYDIASVLVGYGVPFRVFYPTHMLFRAPSARAMLVHTIPNRPFGHKFTKADYDAYLQTRTLLLGQTHMQAALKRGGIVWRLAVGTLGTSGVTQPPSLWGSVTTVDLPGGGFVDDTLTTTELDLLCGAYECISDDGKERSLKSWWPLARYYEKSECGENYGRWTIRRETWYRDRLNSIEGLSSLKPGAQPLSYTEWKSSQHGTRKIRVLHEYAEQSSRDLLASQLTPPLV